MQNILTENEFCLHENKDYFHINGFALSLAYVASVSVRFRSKERGTRVKDRAKNDASKRAGREWLSFHFPRGQTENPVPRSFFAPKLNGSASHAGYTWLRFETKVSGSWEMAYESDSVPIP